MDIKIFAPVDCEVKNIELCHDETFAEKMMGDGILIIPKEKTFVCPFDNAVCKMIFDKKHAYGFEIVPELNALIHCGIDTVDLNGVPFKAHIKVDDHVKKGDILFDVDLNYLKEKNTFSETPIIFENSEKFILEKIDLNQGSFKKGDLIATIYFNEKNKSQDINILQNSLELNDNLKNDNIVEYFKGSSSKWEQIAKQIDEKIGTKKNYSSFLNCMTRMRFEIINKDLVQVEELKKISDVKGVVWAGNQLQVIIGQDVYKLKQAVFNLNNNKANIIEKNKNSYSLKRFFSMFVGIMLPIIPAAIAVGIVQALIALILLTTKQRDFSYSFPVFNPEKIEDFIKDIHKIIILGKFEDILLLILSITGKTFSLFFGVVVAVSAARYFKLNVIMGLAIGLTICSPLLWIMGGFLGLGGEWTLFNYFHVDKSLQLKNPILYTILERMSRFIIQPMNFKMFAIIATIYFTKKLDDFITPYISPKIQLTIKSFIVFFVPVMVGMFIFLPIWNFVEGIFGIGLYGFSKIPYGLGLGFVAAFWEIAVLSGLHIALLIIFTLEQIINGASGGGGYGFFLSISSLAVWAQVGSLIGVIIITKNSKLRSQGLEYLPGGILGITEPILFGINLPKRRPFLFGLVGAFVAGALAGALKVTGRNGTGLGIFEIFGFFTNPVLDPNGELGANNNQLNQIENGIRYLICVGFAIVIPMILVAIFYKERQSEKESIRSLNTKVLKLINKMDISNDDKVKLNESIKQLDNLFTKEEILEFKKVEKDIYKIVKLKTKIENLELKVAKINDKLLEKGRKYINANKLEKAKICKDKIQNSKYNQQLVDLKKELIKITANFNPSNAENIIDNKLLKIDEIIQQLFVFNQDQKDQLHNSYEIALNNLFYNYEIKEKNISLKEFNFKSKK